MHYKYQSIPTILIPKLLVSPTTNAHRASQKFFFIIWVKWPELWTDFLQYGKLNGALYSQGVIMLLWVYILIIFITITGSIIDFITIFMIVSVWIKRLTIGDNLLRTYMNMTMNTNDIPNRDLRCTGTT